MLREQLVAEAREAGRNASHNLEWIRKNPEVMLPGKIESAESYLNNMIRFAEKEMGMKKDCLAGQSRLRSRLMSLLSSILTAERQKRKGETA
ncbi:hypothetical protein B9D94_30785 [Paenibacillus sp. Cedars]|nr:hypothetical protein B9D94_30785 [Paenibacillus sp. Cedars]